MTPQKCWVLKGTHKIDIVNVLAIIITFGSDILKVLGFNSIQKKLISKFVPNPYDFSVSKFCLIFLEFVGDLYIAASARPPRYMNY